MGHWQFIYAKRLSFYPLDYEVAGLGGSESALVRLSRGLGRRGHRVEVFNCCYKPGVYDGVAWRLLSEFPCGSPDVVVYMRFEESVVFPHHSAGRHLFWMLDDRPAGATYFGNKCRARGSRSLSLLVPD